MPVERGGMNTRTVTLDDAGTLAALASEVFTEAYATAFPREQALLSYVQAAFDPRAIDAELQGSTVWYRLGLDGDVPAGFIKMEKSKPFVPLDTNAETIELSKLYVLRRFHGSGMADQLMEEGLGYANAHGVGIVWLCVWERNPRAQAFYRRWGFNVVGDVVIPLDAVPFRDLVMTRVLKS
jgi:diamine N-acetyltransferase